VDTFVASGSGGLNFPGYLAFADLKTGGSGGVLGSCFINSLD
jgi:hypothetical protein